MRSASTSLTLSLLVGLGAIAAACGGDDFDDCRDTLSCPKDDASAATGGTSGNAGRGGASGSSGAGAGGSNGNGGSGGTSGATGGTNGTAPDTGCDLSKS